MTNRFFIASFCLVWLWLALSCAGIAQEPVSTGTTCPELASFDRLMTSFLSEHKLPGAAVSIARHGRVIYARGFGYADLEEKSPVEPRSLFRIASISKPITAVAILQLVEQRRLKLDDPVLDVLDLQLPSSDDSDPRWRDITICQLLQHTGGFDRRQSFDPMFRAVEIAKSRDASPPAKPEHVIAYMLGRKLDFTPGEQYAYSNFGYCLLGRVIEHVTEQPYDDYVRQHVLAPIGVTAMRIGRTRLDGRQPKEVRYYSTRVPVGPSVFAEDLNETVPQPYGAWHLEAMDAHGGWLASAIDLVRFASAFDDPAGCCLLKSDSIVSMFARPNGSAGLDPAGRPKDAYYGCGWLVRPIGETHRANTWHNGSLPGTSTLLVRRHDGLNWAVLFNSRDTKPAEPAGLIDPLMHRAAAEVTDWPTREVETDPN